MLGSIVITNTRIAIGCNVERIANSDVIVMNCPIKPMIELCTDVSAQRSRSA